MKSQQNIGRSDVGGETIVADVFNDFWSRVSADSSLASVALIALGAACLLVIELSLSAL